MSTLPAQAARRKFAAHQTVIVSERRSREPNDLDRRSPLCSPLPASLSQTPTPHRAFVENKRQSAIRPSGDRAVEALFSCFSGLQSWSISAVFSRSNCPVGRGPWARLWGFPANCQLLVANCFLSKSFLETSHPETLARAYVFLAPESIANPDMSSTNASSRSIHFCAVRASRHGSPNSKKNSSLYETKSLPTSLLNVATSLIAPIQPPSLD
jgi:hypothetical protein